MDKFENTKQPELENNPSSDFHQQFLSKIWTDLGWNRSHSNSDSDSSSNRKTPEPADSTQIELGPVPPERDPNRPPDQPPIPPFSAPSDSPSEQVAPPESKTGGKIIELRKLTNSSAEHNTPDAEVRLPANFDPTKPIHLVIYNHGWGSNVQSAFEDNNLDQQMANAPDNTVLIVPEWQRKAGANSGDQGNFQNDNLFRKMVEEIFTKVPELKGKTWDNVDSLGIFAHSAGYGPAETELNKNGLADKVTNITLLDALYDNFGFDDWIKQNARDLNAGTKQFYNFFYDTSKYSNQLVDRVKKIVQPSTLYEDYKNGNNVLDANTLAQHGVVFKYSSAVIPGQGPHWSIPHLYVAPVETAEKQMQKQ